MNLNPQESGISLTHFQKFRVLSLFSGIGALCHLGIKEAGLKDKFLVTQFVENNQYCRKILKRHYPLVPIAYNIKNFKITSQIFDIVVGGSPCQDNSMVNPKRSGLAGERSGLWSEMYRLIREVKPKVVIWENPDGCRHPVKGQTISPLGQILWDLESEGYTTEWETITTKELGSPCIRRRVFVIAHKAQTNWQDYIDQHKSQISQIKGIAYPSGVTLGNTHQEIEKGIESETSSSDTPERRGMADGVAERLYQDRVTILNGYGRWGFWVNSSFDGQIAVDSKTMANRYKRISAIGNSCTPQQAAICWLYVYEVLKNI